VNTPELKWVSEKTVLAIHDEQLAEHGGMPGLRDMTLVQSALHRPQNLAAYGAPDIADLAAAYAYGISHNHGFLDGNKRTAFVVAYVFLLDQGYELMASDQEAVTAMLAVAADEMSEVELAVWFRGYIRPI
jgi:death-on-curing protein